MSGAAVDHSPALHFQRRTGIEISHDDAQRLGVKPGDRVRVTYDGGEHEGAAIVLRRLRPGVVRVAARRPYVGPGTVAAAPPEARGCLTASSSRFIKALVLANLVMLVFAFLTWLERRLLGRFQVRLGPNRVGPFGLLQPIADLVKLIRKESLLPEGISPLLYIAAPVISLFASLAVFAVIPFGEQATIPGTDYQIYLWISDPSVALLVVFALGSLSFYGFLIGGWSSSSKYSLFGSMRAVSQLISYEVSLALAVIGVVMMAQSLSLTGIAEAQNRDGLWYVFPAVPRLPRLRRRVDRRGEPDPVRPARGGGRARRRLPHRVRRHAVRDVPERRVRRADRVLGGRVDPLLRRVRGAVAAGSAVDADQDDVLHPDRDVGARDAARASATTSSCSSAGRCCSRPPP